MEMNSKQWAWLYKQIKDYFVGYAGAVPGDKAADGMIVLYESIMKVTATSRAESEEVDKEIKIVFRILMAIIQSLELEKKPI